MTDFMKLIDANKLKEMLERYAAKLERGAENAEGAIDGANVDEATGLMAGSIAAFQSVAALIGGMSPVDAIPVAWLSEKMRKCDDNGDIEGAAVLSWIIQAWKKEQEAQ